MLVACLVIIPTQSFAKANSQKLSIEASASNLFESLVNRIDSRRKEAEYDAYFKNLQKKQGFNGVDLIANNHQIIYKAALGYSNLESKTKLLVDDQFQLASVSKQFTAVAIMILKERNYLRYDDKVNKYI